MRNVRRSPNKSMYMKLCALYVLTSVKKRQCPEVVGNIYKDANQFCCKFREHFCCDGFMGLKSRDLHWMIQHMKPVCSCTLLDLFQHTTLIGFMKCFTQLMCEGHGPCKDTCAMSLCVEVICLLEVCMPTSFFDVMEHTLIYPVDDLENEGPVGNKWLYSLEWQWVAQKSWCETTPNESKHCEWLHCRRNISNCKSL